MNPESKRMTNKKKHPMVSVSTLSPKKPEKSGLLRRFLDWLAEGAKKPHAGGTMCPS